ncbi:MAG: DUF2589 domain-containing protein [Salibacteraceae bacterium]
MAEEMLPAAEFQALPLEYVISAPLTGVINAQKVAADTTKNFIDSMLNDDKTPVTVDFETAVNQTAADGSTSSSNVKVSAPLLSIVPVPHIRIDSFTSSFNYQITQVAKAATSNEKALSGSAEVGGNPWVKASFKGSISSNASKESTTNRSGSIDITVHASESPIPEGLAKILSLMSNAVTVTPSSSS